MLGPAHRLAGALAGAGWATYAHGSWGVVALTAAVATVTAAGPLSPDMDQTATWHRIPGHGGPLAHRGVTHWVGWPVIGYLLMPLVPGPFVLVVFAMLLGWTSHLIGDFLFHGVPLSPLGGLRVGLPFTTGGTLETVVLTPLMALALLWLLVLLPARTLIGGLA